VPLPPLVRLEISELLSGAFDDAFASPDPVRLETSPDRRPEVTCWWISSIRA
jgi:hypothetical protein